MSIISSHR